MSKALPTAIHLLLILIGTTMIPNAICPPPAPSFQFTVRPRIQFGKPFNIDTYLSTLNNLDPLVTVYQAGFIKQQDYGTNQDKKGQGQLDFNSLITLFKAADTNFQWSENIGKESKVQFFVKDSKFAKIYSRIEFIQPSESNVPGKCMQFDVEVSYTKDDTPLSGGNKKFIETKIVKPGEDKASPTAKKAFEISNLSEKQTISIKKTSKDALCSGQAGVTINKIQLSPESLKATEEIFNGKVKLPPTECTKAVITCTSNDPSKCTGQTQCEKITDDVQQDTIVCHQSTGTGSLKVYTGCTVNQKADATKPTFQKKVNHARFTAMGNDMAAGNVPTGGNAKQDIQVTTSDFNYHQFDQNGCIKLEISLWLSSNLFAKKEFYQCIDPCFLAQKLHSDLSPNTKPFKQDQGFDASMKINTNANAQDAKVKWQSKLKTPSFVQKSLYMELNNKSNKVSQRVTFLDPNGKDENGKGGKERFINQRGLKNNYVEIGLKDLIQNSGYDSQEESFFSLKCQNKDGSIEQIGPIQMIPDFKQPDEHSCLKLKSPVFKTLDGNQISEYTLKNGLSRTPKAFQLPKQPLNLQIQLDDSQCSSAESADKYEIVDIQLRTYDDLENDKDFYNKVELVRMGCNADLCQVLDTGQYEFLQMLAAACTSSDTNYPNNKVCSFTDPKTFKTKKFVQSVGSIDYSKWTECQTAATGDC